MTPAEVRRSARESGGRRALAGYREPIPRDVVCAIGEALYGPDWVSELARALDVQRTTVSRWKAGHTRVTPAIAGELARLLETRGEALAASRRALEPHLG